MARKKRKRKWQRGIVAAKARHRAETHRVFENTALEIPEEVEQFNLTDTKPVRIDVIPYPAGKGNPECDEGELHYERTYWVHFGIGINRTRFVCPRKTAEKPCPICDYIYKLQRDPDADEDLIKDLEPKERQLFNIIDTKQRDKGVQIWDVSFHLFGRQLEYEVRNSDADDAYENFAELEGGWTLKLGIEEQSGRGRKFFKVVSIHFKSRKEDYGEDILDDTTCLDEILIIKDYDELKEVFLQTSDENFEEDEEEKPKKKHKKKQKDEEPEDEEEVQA